SRRPSVPFRVLQRPVDVPPVAGIVDQDHAGNGQAAKDVERCHPHWQRRSRRLCGLRALLRSRSFSGIRNCWWWGSAGSHGLSSINAKSIALLLASGLPRVTGTSSLVIIL